MAASNLQKNQHLLWRAGFGPALRDLESLNLVSQKVLLGKILKDSETIPPKPDVADVEVKRMYHSGRPSANMVKSSTSSNSGENQKVIETDRRKIARISRENIKQLNLYWLNEMVSGKGQLREKMSLFWHGHFAANSGNILHQQLLLGAIRANALGNFGDLLKAVSKSGSMLNYLNNNQNRKNSPNENFAREVMELFTMGRGNYTEKDIKEAARSFTGWGTTPTGEFVFRKQQHDEREKTFLGKTGSFTGDDILDILLEQKQTARHITEKIYRFYVNETIDEKHVATLTDSFYKSGYSIKSLMEGIFESEWFYDQQNIGNRIKSPVELLVGLRRTLDLEIENQPVQLLFQRLLGQLLFYPPNVAGWPGGFAWIDSSSLMLRLQIPKLIIDSEEVKLAPKDNDDQMMGMKDPQIRKAKAKNPNGKKGQSIQATINWPGYVASYEKIKRDVLMQNITSLVLVPQKQGKPLVSEKFIDSSSRESFIRTATIQLMCTPEYQLC